MIFTGQIIERQRDRLTAESKYRIRGNTIEAIQLEQDLRRMTLQTLSVGVGWAMPTLQIAIVLYMK